MAVCVVSCVANPPVLTVRDPVAPCAALRDSIKEVKGEATPFSITSSLPLVADLKREGFGAYTDSNHAATAALALHTACHLTLIVWCALMPCVARYRPANRGLRLVVDVPR